MNGPGAMSIQPGAIVSAPLLDADDPALFPKLTEAQVELLAAHGEVRPTTVGQVLFREGDASYDVMVVLEDSVSVLLGSGEEERELVRQGPGDLMVELNLFTGQGTGATGTVREAGSALAVSGTEFRELVGRDLSFGDFVLQTLFRRRQALERLQLGIRILGSRLIPTRSGCANSRCATDCSTTGSTWTIRELAPGSPSLGSTTHAGPWFC